MKKYNLIIGGSLLLYLLAALVLGKGIYGVETDKNKDYKVEINRIYNSLSSGESMDRLDFRSFKYVVKVTFLATDDMNGKVGKEKATAFYEESNQTRMDIKPLFVKNQLKGFYRFDYHEPEVNIRSVFVLTQMGLAAMEVFIIAILFYLRQQVLVYLKRPSQMPYKLAKGHLKGIVIEEKSQYFQTFLRGIGQLQDRLYVARKRELTLEKEKKKLLLSLSHDIKTPLNTIKLYGKALEENLFEEEMQKTHAVHQIGVKVEKIEHYVEEIMKNSRENILDLEVKKEEFYLADLMKKVLDAYEEKCQLRMVELKIGAFDNRLLKGDIERTLEVFENLFENAFKYGDGRSIQITFYEEEYCQLIRILNTGTTVTDHEFNHIFESFFRAGNSQGKQGNGLGLYICREIMRKMDGEIFAQNEQGGMAFMLVFR